MTMYLRASNYFSMPSHLTIDPDRIRPPRSCPLLRTVAQRRPVAPRANSSRYSKNLGLGDWDWNLGNGDGYAGRPLSLYALTVLISGKATSTLPLMYAPPPLNS